MDEDERRWVLAQATSFVQRRGARPSDARARTLRSAGSQPAQAEQPSAVADREWRDPQELSTAPPAAAPHPSAEEPPPARSIPTEAPARRRRGVVTALVIAVLVAIVGATALLVLGKTKSSPGGVSAIATAKANVRSGPGTNYRVIDMLGAGTKLRIGCAMSTADEGLWGRLVTPHRGSWIGLSNVSTRSQLRNC
jgi:hypothetical protein